MRFFRRDILSAVIGCVIAVVVWVIVLEPKFH
jgi:hypothetical protein